jgi:hypothetical protein
MTVHDDALALANRIGEVKASLVDRFDQLEAGARALADQLRPPPASVLTVARDIPPGATTDLHRLMRLFPEAAKRHGTSQGMWANQSDMLQVLDNGRFRVVLDRAKFPNIPNAAIPLDRPVRAARLSYRATFGPPGTRWHWGGSGKLPGLARHTTGWFPGGSRVGPTNFSNCLAWGPRGSEIGIGPYIYGQHQLVVPDQVWGPNYSDGTLRWASTIVPGLVPGGTHLIEIDHRPPPDAAADSGLSQVAFRVDGVTEWLHTIQLLAPGQPHEITHVHFRVMYGGNNLSYWPPAAVPQTVVEFSDFTVVELPT